MKPNRKSILKVLPFALFIGIVSVVGAVLSKPWSVARAGYIDKLYANQLGILKLEEEKGESVAPC
ncbi:MAG: hypothetical protein AB1516_15290, partial [Pseudomonadota bacterium]